MSERDLEMKSFGPFEIKSEDRGEVVAVVATLGVVDKDGDVILPGALPPTGARVKLSGYDHDSVLKNLPPVGKGVIMEEGDRLLFKGNFFMSTQRGREAFNYTKEMGMDGEWSFGFMKATKNAPLTDEWRTKGAKRLIAGMQAFEASPVFVGAGWGTGTVSTKAADEAQAQLNALAADLANVLADPDAAEAQIAAEALVVDTPADEMARQAEERIAAEAAEAKATEAVALELKRQRDEAMEEYERVQRALRRMGYAA